MFAVIKTGGKQYKVATNDEIVIEKLEAEAGEEYTFEDVLMLEADGELTVGAPSVDGASVTGEVVEQRKGDKVLIFKKRQRSTYRRKKGHRQLETVIKITAILPDGVKAVKPKKKKEVEVKTTEAKVIEAETQKKEEKPKAEVAPKAEKAAETDARGRLSKPQGQKDDLKLIKGVGKVLEGKLNDAGIYHFWQVAALDAAQVEELENDMSFPGRITRDDWIAQARELSKQS
jgi:large subunit ribosomal protein L21